MEKSYWIWIILAIIVIGVIVGLSVGLTVGKSNNSSNQDTVGVFQIRYNGEDLSNPFYKDAITKACKFWDDRILDDIKIDLDFYNYESNDNILAFAYMNSTDDIKGGGVIYINTYKNPETSWEDIIAHEIGHVLGIGTSDLWDDSNNLDILDKNNFPKAYQAYKEWAEENNITVNNDGIPLSDESYHWSEEIFDIEMMTPYSEVKGINLPCSKITLSCLIDMGWNIDLNLSEELI